MRISTTTMYESGLARMSELQSAAVKTQQQIATGRRILTPADDPVAAARALEVSQGQSVNNQLAINRNNAKDSLTFEESILQSVTTLLQDVKTLTVNAGSGALDDVQRGFLATELSGRFDELLSFANTRDGMGSYIFAGYQVTSPAFAKSVGGATFTGDQGQRMLQVAASQQMAISDTGNDVFQSMSGNGTFVVAAQSNTVGGVIVPTNTGTGVIGVGSVVNPAAITGHDYDVVFSVAAGVTTYSVVDNTTSTTLSAGNAYVSGQPITFDGMQFDISGSPADTDTFTVQPSSKQNVFAIVSDLINVLKSSASNGTGRANLANGLSAANAHVDQALDSVLSTRASIGARLRELDSLDSLGDAQGLQYAETLAELQELDYAAAITNLTIQQTTLEAAQKSFIKVSGLSLFNML